MMEISRPRPSARLPPVPEAACLIPMAVGFPATSIRCPWLAHVPSQDTQQTACARTPCVPMGGRDSNQDVVVVEGARVLTSTLNSGTQTLRIRRHELLGSLSASSLSGTRLRIDRMRMLCRDAFAAGHPHHPGRLLGLPCSDLGRVPMYFNDYCIIAQLHPCVNQCSKPSLWWVAQFPDLCYNLSHSCMVHSLRRDCAGVSS